MTSQNLPDITVRRASVEEILDLRHRVLRKGMPRETANFAGDDHPDAFHVAAFDTKENALGCVTLHPEPMPEGDGTPAWRLRGMATEPLWQGRGIGQQVEAFAMQSLQDLSSNPQVWCNARIVAVPFYEKMSWRIVSEVFDVPKIGPHHRMEKKW